MKTDLATLEIKHLEKSEVYTLLEWAAAEGWNPGTYDAEVFWETDPDGFIGVFEQAKLIGAGAIVSYGGQFGFMGLFIVHPSYRGMGIGNKLWYYRRDLLRKRLQPEAAIGMDGVLAMQPFYQKGGFVIAYKDVRYAFKSAEWPQAAQVESIQEADVDKLLAYDVRHFGFPRKTFLSKWLFMPGSSAVQYIDAQQQVRGYAVVRKAETGYRVGPLYADTPTIATALFTTCLSISPNETVFMDVPFSNPNALTLVAQFGGTYVFECARMYNGQAPAIAIENIYGISTLELG